MLMQITQNNLSLRILSATLLIPFVIVAIVSGGWVFGVFVALAFGFSCGEWYEMTDKTNRRYTYLIAGLIYFALSFSLFTFLRIMDHNGLYFTMSLMLSVWAADTFAYIVGKNVGGPKMSPNISPKKTWSGMAGAVLGSAFCFAFLMEIAKPLSGLIPNSIDLSLSQLPLLLVYGGIMGYVGQAGDLLISLMKRKAGIKDSGNLIPGHGGILDRIDSLLLVTPVFLVATHYGF